MNYIKHLNAVLDHMDKNLALSAHHISLYLALFRRWNKNFFQNPIIVVRDELMKTSRIGSVNTYTKCLKQLDHFGYIQYKPSYNRNIGSQIHLFIFDKGCELAVSPFINKTNYFLIQRDEKLNDEILNQNSMAKNDLSGYGPDIPPSEDHIKIYFSEKGFPPIEAEKFFNYYQSNGWLVGGKSKMKDWKAAARNWILNQQRFNGRGTSPRPTSKAKNEGLPKLGFTQFREDKEYDTPL